MSEDGETVLTPGPTVTADEFPTGMTPRELAHALRGQRLDHFHLQEFIGGGGMGVVFKALDTSLGRTVAVKVVASQGVSQEDLQLRFKVEAQSTARLDHPNIAHIYLVGRDRGLSYIVFEYIEGVNLRDLVLNHGAIPLGDALGFTYQIAHALAHAWQREVVHRDIKPSNILVTPEGQAKLVDMGLARLYQGDARVDPLTTDLTTTGVTLGTFDYISPEQARDPREADTRSDIYSLGCTLFYMLSGRPPFAEGTAAQKLLQHQNHSPPDLQTICTDVPESVNAMVQRMLAKLPTDRFQSPEELACQIAESMRSLGLPLPQSLAPLLLEPKSWSTTTWRRQARQLAPWAIPLLTVVAVGGWFGIDGNRGQDGFNLPPIRSAAETVSSPKQVLIVSSIPTTPEEKKTPSLEEKSSQDSAAKGRFQIDVGSIFQEEKLLLEEAESKDDPTRLDFLEPIEPDDVQNLGFEE